MSATRKNISFAQQIAIDRQGNDYVYGGNWDPYDRGVGTDCSGCVIDELDASLHGTAMGWRRNADGGGGSTEDFRPYSMGGSADPSNGPMGLVMVDHPNEFPADAAVRVAFHHGPGGGENSHTWCQVDGLQVETNGDNGTVLNDGVHFHDEVLSVYAVDGVNGYGANNWWYLPGPIVEDGTPVPTAPSPLPGSVGGSETSTDTLFADVSEFQCPVDDSYPYRVLTIRSNDGTYQDHHFAQNYAWCKAAADAGRLDAFIVYFYWHPNWLDGVNTMKAMVGEPHPKMIAMIDVERGENPDGDFSDALNATDDALVQWLGDPRRVIAYGNPGDLNSMWPNRREDQLVVASYGSNPDYPGKLAHQYTDGNGYGGGLPEGCSPFGHCDMNSADGFSPEQFAAACGIGGLFMALSPQQQEDMYNMVALIFQQVAGVIPGLELLPGSPTLMPADWPVSLKDVLK